MLNILATKRLKLNSIPLLTNFLQSSACDRSHAFPIFTKMRNSCYCNYAYLTCVSHIYKDDYPELAIPSTALSFCYIITCLHL